MVRAPLVLASLLMVAGCGPTAFDRAVMAGDLKAAIAHDVEASHFEGVSENRLKVLAELTLLEAVRHGADFDARLALTELRALGPHAEVLLDILEREGSLRRFGEMGGRVTAPAGSPAAPVVDGGTPAETDTQLVGDLWSRDPSVRAHAALVLGDRGARESIRLVMLDRESDRFVRLTLAAGLVQTRPGRAIPVLEDLCAGRDLAAAEAANILVARGNQGAVLALMKLAGAGPAVVRVAAIRGLARAVPNPRLVPSALEDPNPRIRIAAAGAILFALRDHET
ncbi:MAG: hypothetical protein R3A78_13100 [Polyangiales bacterium]